MKSQISGSLGQTQRQRQRSHLSGEEQTQTRADDMVPGSLRDVGAVQVEKE